MELSLEGGEEELSAYQLASIINNEMDNIHHIEPFECDLDQYDQFLQGENNGSKLTSES